MTTELLILAAAVAVASTAMAVLVVAHINYRRHRNIIKRFW